MIESPMAKNERATLVLFITKAQRDALMVKLTSALFSNVIEKVMHGIVVQHDYNYSGEVPFKSCNPICLCLYI